MRAVASLMASNVNGVKQEANRQEQAYVAKDPQGHKIEMGAIPTAA